MQAGLYVQILYSRSTEFSWMLKNTMVQVISKLERSITVLRCGLMSEAELWKTPEQKNLSRNEYDKYIQN